MTPSEVKRYLSDRKVAPLHDIALHFDMQPDAIRGLLEHWIRKGKVRRFADSGCDDNCCGGCSENGHKEVYEWI